MQTQYMQQGYYPYAYTSTQQGGIYDEKINILTLKKKLYTFHRLSNGSA